ncbi:MAG: biotin/lipoyl-containing protein, partial [Halothiobacillaceae bacterium]
MALLETILLPDVGNFDQIPVIEILAQVGDTIEKDQSLLTLETDKATMEIPAPKAGVLVEWLVKLGDKLSKGMPIAQFELSA